jgi:hypothetical protein
MLDPDGWLRLPNVMPLVRAVAEVLLVGGVLSCYAVAGYVCRAPETPGDAGGGQSA